MILFDLLCSKGHGFEAWFRDSDSFDRLAAADEVQCAVCGDTQVKKALMAPNVRTSKAMQRQEAGEMAEETSASPSRESDSRAEGEATASIPISKAVQEAPTVQQKDQATLSERPAAFPVPEKVAEAMRVLREVQTHIEKNFDHVGQKFAEEARKMHYGEAEKRSIYGEATKEETEELADEGIEVNQMPWLNTRNS